MSIDKSRRRRGPRACPLPALEEPGGCGSLARTETRLIELGQIRAADVVRLPLAKRLRRVLREPEPRRCAERIHREPRGTPSARDLPRGVPPIAAKVRH